ncbi:MAG: hypothetical protein RXR06_11210 [Thermoproteus sp.]
MSRIQVQEKGVKASSVGIYYGISTSIDINTLVYEVLNFFLYIIMFWITTKLVISAFKQISSAIH